LCGINAMSAKQNNTKWEPKVEINKNTEDLMTIFKIHEYSVFIN